MDSLTIAEANLVFAGAFGRSESMVAGALADARVGEYERAKELGMRIYRDRGSVVIENGGRVIDAPNIDDAWINAAHVIKVE